MRIVKDENYEWVFEDKPLSMGTKTFGINLSALVNSSGMRVTQLCNELQISRTQLSRYINGLSYPKPHTLVQIGRVFGVDARILTHKLFAAPRAKENGGYAGFTDVLCDNGFFAKSNQDCEFMVPDQRTIEDGLYYSWHTSIAAPGRFYRSIVQIKTKKGVKIFSSKDFKNDWSEHPEASSGIKKEIGICFQLTNGFSVLNFIPNSELNYYSSFQKHSWLHTHRYLGIGFWTISGHRSQPHLQAIALEKATKCFKDIVHFSRRIGFCKKNDLPEFSWKHFNCFESGEQSNFVAKFRAG